MDGKAALARGPRYGVVIGALLLAYCSGSTEHGTPAAGGTNPTAGTTSGAVAAGGTTATGGTDATGGVNDVGGMNGGGGSAPAGAGYYNFGGHTGACLMNPCMLGCSMGSACSGGSSNGGVPSGAGGEGGVPSGVGGNAGGEGGAAPPPPPAARVRTPPATACYELASYDAACLPADDSLLDWLSLSVSCDGHVVAGPLRGFGTAQCCYSVTCASGAR